MKDLTITLGHGLFKAVLLCRRLLILLDNRTVIFYRLLNELWNALEFDTLVVWLSLISSLHHMILDYCGGVKDNYWFWDV